ncbi:MAG: Uma2 family endonuclease [Tunicatimonas sp.]|uniref:Uma2 family endonuclease n=1 Tax=Tunicatimonas sp. TaxID=1940096 RepID=UPI003C73B599
MEKYAIKLPKTLQFTDDEFYAFCQENRDLRFERNTYGEIIIMSPTGGLTGKKNSSITSRLWIWNDENGLGEVFNSSTGFLLANGAMRSPDAAWIAKSRWDALSYDEQEKFPPLCPDFIVELISPSDTLKESQEKMDEWMANGCRMGWLIFPKEEKAWIYHDNKVEPTIGFDQTLSGKTVLPGFTFDLAWLK